MDKVVDSMFDMIEGMWNRIESVNEALIITILIRFFAMKNVTFATSS